MAAKNFSHIDGKGKAKMVDVGDKPDLKRTAVAKGSIFLAKETIKLIKDNKMKKGDVLAVARIAGIQAAKKTGDLIPLCHPLLLNNIEVDCETFHNQVKITSRVECTGKTGVEMEALTAVSVALLTIYDMCKAVDKKMRIGEIKLCQKLKTPA
ncbi:molybdenum cofactor biosynthesis protein C [candidate division WOR-1 bacterium RIFOXYA12_FULL_43_27]|uniref:Molybdenum cofactor biosynthesis protein C n=1 Tax=candidate division WOR-1 bacterium RIFOXYC2_FULL_46_14 TaxID=1802587 RepID=A0A1F4U5F8_UNCSA|nr:MAG: molybdenum cofactor biosynthesis protein C [candidate division WOR-1 bacterium RIFOXYA12_FULL_43_27]OGC20348.1 MAG: molybdenum cofactor biosynthesis protein C [candidate division WOR-1 bacterium RIFOXYB2_FULL_46_45]OGC31915.1 MAG: molybdenum cofactor biosynthesis protein C [candidate division WOR-1 bacterium RIFOXYA2_FULL_46_56]OGC40194.1 MAG: molybdenum cofactor biosynthesis protein C [candidate division WOR-1 bacterium RIFOXYC2_FULL_46_14]